MNVALWIVQVLLAGMFSMTGFGKLTQPREKLIEMTPYAEDFTQRTLRGIGTLEALAAVGLLLPSITGILPWLTPLAATGLIFVMIGAMLTHYRRQEYPFIAVNAVLLALAAFVAYGRFVSVSL